MADELDAVVAQVLRRTKAGLDAHDSRRRSYDRAYNIYRSPRPRSPSPWQSNVRVKYAKQVIDTELVNIVSGKPRAKVLPRHPQDELAAKSMQYVLDYFTAQDHLVEKQPVFTQQALIYGVTVAKNHWLFDEGAGVDRPTFEPWDITDAWWDPDGRDVDSSDYVVLRSWVTPDYCRQRAHNPDTGNGVFHNVDELLKTGPGQQREATAQESFLGGTDSRRKDKIELWEIWRDDELIVIGNRQVLLRHQKNPYAHGRKPIVIAQVMPDLFEMRGFSETEVVEDVQEALQTLQNMTIDNVHLTTMRGVTYREGSVSDPNAIELKPRFKWPVQDHDDIRPFEIQPIASDVFTERQRLLADLQLVSGVNPYVSGSDMGSVDQNTATGVTALQEVASRLLRFKAGIIQYKGYQRTFEQWAEMVKQFLDTEVAVRIEGPGNEYHWRGFSQADIAGSFDIIIEGTEESLSKQQARGEASAMLNTIAPYVQLGVVDPTEAIKRFAVAFDFPNPEALIKQQQPLPPAAPYQQPPSAQPAQQLLGGRPLGVQALNAVNQGA
jgi:hypothetical protein